MNTWNNGKISCVWWLYKIVSQCVLKKEAKTNTWSKLAADFLSEILGWTGQARVIQGICMWWIQIPEDWISALTYGADAKDTDMFGYAHRKQLFVYSCLSLESQSYYGVYASVPALQRNAPEEIISEHNVCTRPRPRTYKKKFKHGICYQINFKKRVRDLLWTQRKYEMMWCRSNFSVLVQH